MDVTSYPVEKDDARIASPLQAPLPISTVDRISPTLMGQAAICRAIDYEVRLQMEGQ